MGEEEFKYLDFAERGSFDEKWSLQFEEHQPVLWTDDVCIELGVGFRVVTVLQEELNCFDSAEIDSFL